VVIGGKKGVLMEGVEGLMKGLKLSEAERVGVRIRGSGVKEKKQGMEEMAVGWLMAEKPAITEAMENVLGPLWCPMKGIKVKDLGENRFLFLSYNHRGRRKR
jgi:hypothetical protein